MDSNFSYADAVNLVVALPSFTFADAVDLGKAEAERTADAAAQRPHQMHAWLLPASPDPALTWGHAAGTPGHAPRGCAGRCVPGQSARQYVGQGPMDFAAVTGTPGGMPMARPGSRSEGGYLKAFHAGREHSC